MYMNTTYSTKQSAVAMRKRMSDDTNKYNFNRKRILDRIREGSIPQQNTTKKYDISNAEVNAIRKEGNHPPLVVAFAPSAYAPTLAVNEETKRIQAQYLEQQQLTKNVKEDEQKLVQSFKKLMVEQRGKILKVPPGQQFALKTFHDYVWNRGTGGQPTSWVINITGKKAKETTIQRRFGKENDWKSGQVYLFFTRFLPPECLKDVRRCLKKERIGPILKKLRDKEASNPSTTLSTNQALYVLYRNFPGLLPEFQTDLNWLHNFTAVTKNKADTYIPDKRQYPHNYGFRHTKKIFNDIPKQIMLEASSLTDLIENTRSQGDLSVPNLTGLSEEEAIKKSQELGLKVLINGKGTVIEQQPEAGAKISNHQQVILKLS